jgi:hypothetical protein
MPKRSTAQSFTLEPPLLGLNYKDPISSMDSRYALTLENLIPIGSELKLRAGSEIHATGIPTTGLISGGVFLLRAFATTTGNFLVATDDATGIWNVTSAGAAVNIKGAAPVANNFTEMLQFRDRLFITTALDDVYSWTGAGNIAVAGFTIGGVATNNLGGMAAYKSRIYFNQLLSHRLYYGGVDAITGPLTLFDYTSLMTMGGYTRFMGTVTRAKDFSEDELFCIVSTKGEVLVYQGDFPTATNWALLGRYVIPRPLSTRAFVYIGADLYILTEQGIISMTAVMAGQRIGGKYITLSENIDPLFTADVQDSIGNRDWCAANHAAGGYFIVNISAEARTGGAQWVYSFFNQAWAKFTGWDAWSWEVLDGKLYFGKGANVMLADIGDADEDPANPGDFKARNIKMKQAFNYFGDRSLNKQFIQAIPLIKQSQGLEITLGVDVDYQDDPPTDTLTDTTSLTYDLYQPTIDLDKYGKAAALRIQDSVVNKEWALQATEIIFEVGDIG